MSDAKSTLRLWSGQDLLGDPSPADFADAVSARRAVGWVDAQNSDVARHEIESLQLAGFTNEVLDHVFAPLTFTARAVGSVGSVRIVECRYVDLSDDSGLTLWPVRVAASESDLWLTTISSFGAEPRTENGGDVAGRLVDAAQAGSGQPGGTAQDLGALLVAGSIDSVRGATRRLSQQCLAVKDNTPDARLGALSKAISELELVVSDLEQPGRPSTNAWFQPGNERTAADEGAVELARAGASLRELGRDIRGWQDERRAKRDQRRTEGLQLLLAFVTAVFLGPTLIATVLAAFPGWLTEGHRADAFGGLSLACAGLVLLVVYGAPTLLASADRRLMSLRTLAIVAGAAMTAVGVAWALPLPSRIDDQAPQLALTCPAHVTLGQQVHALVAASSADVGLQSNPSGAPLLDTSTLGPHNYHVRVTDRYGRATTTSCEYMVDEAIQAKTSKR